MAAFGSWPDTPDLEGRRVRLEPLRVKHARKLGPLLDDPRLHVFVGGEPADLAELQQRYRRWIVGCSRDGSQRWLNWVARRRSDGRAVGTVQATVAEQAGGLIAEVAWVIASAHQGRGYARDAAETMMAWLRRQGVSTVVAPRAP